MAAICFSTICYFVHFPVTITFVVAEITFKVAVVISSVVKITFVVAEITFKVVVITSSVI